MGASDLRVTVDSAKPRCVLDPALALGHPLGPRLALGLTRVFETWLTRSFWQAVDSSELLRRPLPAEDEVAAPDAVALEQWLTLRDTTDAGSWRLRWVGDSLAESQLRDGGDEGLVERYECFAAALATREDSSDARRERWNLGLDLRAAALDTLALSATLDGALVLCNLPPATEAPGPVQALPRLGLQALAMDDDAVSLFATERTVVRHALAAAGLAALLQPLGRFAAVHALALPDDAPADAPCDPWRTIRIWWYTL